MIAIRVTFISFLFFSFAGYCFANDETIYVCKPQESTQRTIALTDAKSVLKTLGPLDKFYSGQQLFKGLVVAGLETANPKIKVISNFPDTETSMEVTGIVVKRTEDEIVLIEIIGVRSSMLTIWPKERKAVYYKTEAGSFELSTYVHALNCQ